MAKYALDKLNDKELEELARDFLQKEMTIRFECFRRGIDKGIDLRYSSATGKKKIIVQVKHYIGSKFTDLYRVLQEELEKIKAIKPTRYIVVTTVSLLPQQKDKIFALFAGYIHTTGDIYGLEDIENCIDRHTVILKNFPKLYLPNIEILQELLNSPVNARSRDKLQEIQERIHLYVPNDRHKEAIAILDKEHFLIITGEPGIGKTSLAEYIAFQKYSEKFRFVYILSDLKDAEKFMDTDDPVIFYFDDFLGANYLRIKQDTHLDSTLLDFIRRVNKSANKRLILTTRTTILNQAKTDFEKLKNRQLNLSRHEVHISDYSKIQKAEILYNHIYHSKLNNEYLLNFINKRSYLDIIRHKNYNPRLIAYISDSMHLLQVLPSNYPEFVMNMLNNPKEIWKDPYESQISEAGKFLLQTLFTIPEYRHESEIKEAFNARVDFEVRHNNFTRKANLYELALQELLGGFLHRKIEEDACYITFYNPSISDFLAFYIKQSEESILAILHSIVFSYQFEHAFYTKKRLKQPNLFGYYMTWSDKLEINQELFLDTVAKKIEKLKFSITKGSTSLILCDFLLTNLHPEICDEYISKYYSTLELKTIENSQFGAMLSLMEFAGLPNSKTGLYIRRDFYKLAFRMFEICISYQNFRSTRALFEVYDFDYEAFFEKYEIELRKLVENFWTEDTINELIVDEDLSDIVDEDEIKDKIEDAKDKARKLNYSMGLGDSYTFYQFRDFDYDTILLENRWKNQPIASQEPRQPMQSSFHKEIEIDQVENLFDNLLSLKQSSNINS